VWASAGAVALLVMYVNLSGAPVQQQVAQVRPNDQTGLFTDSPAVPANRDETFLTITDMRHGE
jgi:hypothetical protein